jgi:hypothetical protein
MYIWVTRMVSYKKQEPLTLREHLRSHPPPTPGGFGVVCVAHLFLVNLLCVFVFLVSCCCARCDFRMFGSSLSPVVCWVGAFLIYVICVCLRVVVFSIYCVCVLFFFVLCALCCRFLWIFLFLFPLPCSLAFINLIIFCMHWYCNLKSSLFFIEIHTL